VKAALLLALIIVIPGAAPAELAPGFDHPSTGGSVVRSTLLHIDGLNALRRDDSAKEVFIIVWEAADLVIPWPKGLSMRDAILEWARRQDGR
jgi:hypothetical protein